MDQTSTAWHDYNNCLWHLGIIRRLWCHRLIGMWLRLAELPYQVSSWRTRKEAVSRLAKRQQYHMITMANGYTSHPFFCIKNFSEGIGRLHLYQIIRVENKLFYLYWQVTGVRCIFKIMLLLFAILSVLIGKMDKLASQNQHYSFGRWPAYFNVLDISKKPLKSKNS